MRAVPSPQPPPCTHPNHGERAPQDVAEEFKKIFERFASAEELTGTVKREEDEDEEDEQQRQRQQEEAAAAAKEAAKEADSQSEEGETRSLAAGAWCTAAA